MDTPQPFLDVEPVSSPIPTSPIRPPRRRLRRLRLTVATVALGVSLFGAGIAVDRNVLQAPAGAGDAVSGQGAEFELIREAWNDLHEKYVGAADLSDRDLAYGAIEGLTEAVGDTGHTSFLTPEDLAATHDSLSGSYVGVGIRLDVEAGVPVVIGIIRGGSAAEADVRQGDRIVALEGKSTSGLTIDEVASRVRGEAGTSVTLTLERSGADEPIAVTLKRAEIDLPAVSWAKIPGTDLAMLRLEQFSSGAGDELKAALAEIVKANVAGLVLDLRANPGGYVNEAVAVASQFLSDGTVYRQRDAGGKEETNQAQPGGLATKIPLVVLVDGASASSSEIVTGALQDHDRATVIGQTTFGTGTVLSEEPLADGSALRIGVVEWLTPDGHQIWHHGITPDIEAALADGAVPIVPDDLAGMTAAEVTAGGDSQLAKAIETLSKAIPTTPTTPTASPEVPVAEGSGAAR